MVHLKGQNLAKSKLSEKIEMSRKRYTPKQIIGTLQKAEVRLSKARLRERSAVALAMEPAAMLFDEPTSALGPEMIKEVLDVMTELAGEGMTMIVETHEMGFARHVADEIVFMDRGHIEERCSRQDFFESPRG